MIASASIRASPVGLDRMAGGNEFFYKNRPETFDKQNNSGIVTIDLCHVCNGDSSRTDSISRGSPDSADWVLPPSGSSLPLTAVRRPPEPAGSEFPSSLRHCDGGLFSNVGPPFPGRPFFVFPAMTRRTAREIKQRSSGVFTMICPLQIFPPLVAYMRMRTVAGRPRAFLSRAQPGEPLKRSKHDQSAGC